MKRGTPVLYEFFQFPAEYGIISRKVKGEPNVYIVEFPLRQEKKKQKQRISTDHLREPDEKDDPEILGRIRAIHRKRKYPMIHTAFYKGILKVADATICSLTHMNLEEGEEVIRFKGEEQVFSKKWIENYWNYIDEMTEGECPPKHPITYADMLSQDDIERFTVSLDS